MTKLRYIFLLFALQSCSPGVIVTESDLASNPVEQSLKKHGHAPGDKRISSSIKFDIDRLSREVPAPSFLKIMSEVDTRCLPNRQGLASCIVSRRETERSSSLISGRPVMTVWKMSISYNYTNNRIGNIFVNVESSANFAEFMNSGGSSGRAK